MKTRKNFEKTYDDVLNMNSVHSEMPNYRGIQYLKDSDGLWKVMMSGDVFIVALDDSKTFGKKTINWQRNNSQTCKEYIDWVLTEIS